MGYTHYWRHTPAFTEGFVDDVDRIIAEAARQGIVLRGRNGTGEPEFSPTNISFNGDDETGHRLGHETFALIPGDDEFTFCKTAQKPYDAVVGAILIALKESDQSFSVTSDGEWGTSDWTGPADLFEAATGRAALDPLDHE